MRFLLLLGVMIFWGTVSYAVEKERIASYRVLKSSTKQFQTIVDNFEIYSADENSLIVYVPDFRISEFKQFSPDAELISEDINKDINSRFDQKSNDVEGYRDIEQVYHYMAMLVEQYPDIVSVEEFGKTKQGRSLLALKISDNVAVDEDEPEILLTSATHGDEAITVEVNLRLIQELVEGFGHDQRLTSMVANYELYFIPVLNADGFSSRSRYANGVDPNRNYPWPDNPTRKSIDCIQAERDFVASRNFVGSMDFHASGRMVMYPWAYTYDFPPDDVSYSQLANYMAEQNQYKAGQISKVIYMARGSSADYWYWKHGVTAFGIELAHSKVPRSSQIAQIVTEAREMTWRFIENF